MDREGPPRGVDEETLEKLSTNIEDIDPVKVRDIIKFGIRCACDPQALSKTDFDQLRAMACGSRRSWSWSPCPPWPSTRIS
jgi:hypothetical protein